MPSWLHASCMASRPPVNWTWRYPRRVRATCASAGSRESSTSAGTGSGESGMCTAAITPWGVAWWKTIEKGTKVATYYPGPGPREGAARGTGRLC